MDHQEGVGFYMCSSRSIFSNAEIKILGNTTHNLCVVILNQIKVLDFDKP